MDIVDEGVISETHILLEYKGFHGKSVDEASYLLEWIVWDSFEFEKTSLISRYSSSDPGAFYRRSYYAFLGMICVALLTMKLTRVLIWHVMISYYGSC